MSTQSYNYRLFSILPLLVMTCLPVLSMANDEQNDLCHSPVYQPKFSGPEQKDDQTHIQADHVSLSKDNVSIFTGNVDIRRNDQFITADRVEYQQNENFLQAQGKVQFNTPQIKIEASKAEFHIDDNQSNLENILFTTTQRAHGGADSIRVISENLAIMTNARYTTCDPDKTDWLLSADEIKLDNEKHQGYADDVVLRFKGVPFFYLPYMRFPIGEERLSGFLFPNIGSSEQHGSELLIPYYWNIAPDMDATISPWVMSKRGTMLLSEWRYLNKNSAGQLELDYLNDDKEYHDDRQRARWIHKGQSPSGWSTSIDYNYVADVNHVEDFSDKLEDISLTHLNRQGTVNYNSRNWQFTANVQSYQTLSGEEPYRRLPQLTLTSRNIEKNKKFNFYVESELVRFDHPDDKVIGNRFDLNTAISYPIRTAATFFIPRLNLRHTQYQLDQTTVGEEQNPYRNLPMFSIDSGIIFERDTQLFGTPLVQTLEPQLYYLYVPYRDQSDLPVFDTSIYGFNVNHFFVADRFIGTDRVADANQLTAALATRFYHANTGAELFSARIGQVFYYADREVTLPGNTIETRSKSNIIAELIARPSSHWYLGTDVEWDIEADNTAAANARLAYQSGNNVQIQGIYRFDRDDLKTAELGFRWRITPRWQITARQLDDLLLEQSLETQLALRYDSCCWGLTLQWDDRNLPDQLEREKSILLQLELKGLSSIGNRRTITGFE
jgi:LPS-assembly protein